MSAAAQNLDDHLENNSPDEYNMMPFTRQAYKRTEQLKQIASLPEAVKRKIRALRKLQLKTTDLEAEFHRKVYELERTFEEKHKAIFDKRNQIVNGEYEPNDEECEFPDADISPEFIQTVADLNIDSDDNIASDNPIKGIPSFWLTILKYVPLFESIVKEHDEPALKHLIDIRAISKPGPELSFLLEFHFSTNEFFSNIVLTKEYFLKCSPDPEDPFSFDGPEIYKCVGCDIKWNEGKDLTTKTVKRKNQERPLKTMKVPSFFNFFDPPEVPEDENDPLFEDINTILETDFEVGHYLKERIIPRAILFFTGESEDFSDNTSEDNVESEDCVATDEELPDGGVDGEGDVVS